MKSARFRARIPHGIHGSAPHPDILPAEPEDARTPSRTLKKEASRVRAGLRRHRGPAAGPWAAGAGGLLPGGGEARDFRRALRRLPLIGPPLAPKNNILVCLLGARRGS